MKWICLWAIIIIAIPTAAFATSSEGTGKIDGFAAPAPVFTSRPSLLDGVRFEQRLGSFIPLDLSVTDQFGMTRPLSAFVSRRPTIFVLSYYMCPNLCTLILNGVAQAILPLKTGLGRKFDVVSLSIDPGESSRLARAKRQTYLARLGLTEDDAGESWPFLTASPQAIKKIADAAGFHYRRDDKTGQYLHPSGFVVLTPAGMISQYFFGIQFDTKNLERAIESASQGHRGNWIQEVLLYCFHFDPALSTHGPVIFKILRIAGTAGVLAIAVMLAWLYKLGPRGGLA